MTLLVAVIAEVVVVAVVSIITAENSAAVLTAGIVVFVTVRTQEMVVVGISIVVVDQLLTVIADTALVISAGAAQNVVFD